MKFVHIADMHFDIPFTTIAELGNKRRLEQRDVFKKCINYVKKNNIPYLFISGDLYEQEYVKQSTIEFINNLFKEIPNTLIYIAPGNHDPYLLNSFYYNFEWNENVHIFNKLEKIKVNNDINIYGFGFSDFYERNSEINNIELDEKEKINILVVHGSLDSGYDDNREYNPLTYKSLKEIGFDYIALGHIHKRYISEDNRLVYPGSMISMGFDELGEHGMIVGDVQKDNINLEFIKLDNTEFVEYELDISSIYTQEDLIEKINQINWNNNRMYKIILIGYRRFDINVINIKKLIDIENIIKIKDKTKMEINVEQMARNINLKGIFAKQMLEKLNNTIDKDEKEKIKKAIEIGIEALEK